MVSEHPGFLGSYVDSKNIGCCLAEIVCQSGAALGLFVRSCVNLKTAFGLLKESNFMESIILKTLLGFHFEVKILTLSSF